MNGRTASDVKHGRVFISHSNKDHAQAMALCSMLEHQGISCWIAPRDINPGASWASTIIEAISHCDIMVLLFSEHANASRQVLREVERALQRDRKILTYRIDDTSPQADMEYFLSTEQWLDARPGSGQHGPRELAQSVQRLLNESEAAVRQPGPATRRPNRKGAMGPRRWQIGVMFAVLLSLAVAIWNWVPRLDSETGQPAPMALTELQSIAVLPFENRSQTASIDWLSTALADMVITDLSQSETLRVLSNQELYSTVSQELIMAGTIAAPAKLEQLASEAGVGAVLSGSYAQLGERLQVSLSLTDVGSGQLLLSRRNAGPPDEIFDIVDALTQEVRVALRPDSSNVLDRDLKDVTTDSLAAYRLYAEGLQLDLQLKREAAIPLLERAVELDPGFAMAHARLGWIQENLGQVSESSSSFDAAFAHRERLPARERYLVEGLHFAQSWDRYHRAVESFEAALALDPSLHSARHQLATVLAKMERVDDAMEHWQRLREIGYDYPGVESGLANMLYARDREAEAERVLLEAARRQPDNAAVRLALSWYYVNAGKLDDGRRQISLARELEPAGSSFLTQTEYRAALLQRDLDAAQARSDDLLTMPDAYAQWLGHTNAANLRVLEDQLTAALEQLQAAEAAYGSENAFTAMARLHRARVLLESGSPQAAAGLAQEAFTSGAGSWVSWEALFVMARALWAQGQAEQALELTDELRRQAELDGGPALHRLALRLEGYMAADPQRAVDAFEAAAELLTENGVQFHFQRLPDHAQTWYELGQAYLRAERYEAAATQFQQLIDSQIERIMAPLYYVRAYHGLGTAQAALGNTRAAADAYAQFLSYWPRGRFDSERVQEARAFMRENPQLTQNLSR